VYKYQFLYIHYPKYETYGRYAPMLVNRCMTGLIIFQVTMVGIISLKTESYYGIYMGPLIPLSLIAVWWFKKAFEGHLLFLSLETISKMTAENDIINMNKKKMTYNNDSSNNTYVDIPRLHKKYSDIEEDEEEASPSNHQSDDSISAFEPKKSNEC